MNELKVRCSALGNITHIDSATKLTEKQSTELIRLQNKESLTENQRDELARLIEKLHAKPQLSKGAKTYIRDMFFGDKFDYQKSFTNRFVQKGHAKEVAAINEVVKYLGLPMVVKNEKHFVNDYIHGTPDTIFKTLNFQIDIKNAYYPNGLDSFEDTPEHNYIEQAHGYDWLTGVDNGFIIKILMNLPEALLEKEAYVLMKEAGIDRMTDDFLQEVRDLYNFERLPIADRIKIFKVETKEEDKLRIKTSVELAREYYAELTELWKVKNDKNIEYIKELSQTI